MVGTSHAWVGSKVHHATARSAHFTRGLPGLTDEQWEKKLGLRHGQQIDHVLYSPGRAQRRGMAPVRRLQWFVDYDHGRRQLSDHFGIRTYIQEISRLQVNTRLRPERTTVRVSRVHCLLEAEPHNGVDQLRV